MRFRSVAAALSVLVLALVLTSCQKPANIVIDTPVHGTFSTAAQVTVNGRVLNVNNPAVNAAVTLNGAAVTVQADGSWSTVVSLDSNIVFNPLLAELTVLTNGRTVRARHVVIAGPSVADGALSMDSVALRLNDSGLDAVEPLVSSLVNLDIASLLPVGTQVINDFCAIDGGFVGCLGSVDVNIANPPPSFSGFGLDVDSMVNFAAGDVVVNDIRVDTQINGSGLAPSCGLRVTAASVTIAGDYSLSPDGVDPTQIDVNLNGAPGLSFTSFNYQFTSGLCDFPLIGDLIDLIIGSQIQPAVTNGLRDFLADPDGGGPVDAPIAEGIEVALADISIAGPIGDSLGVTLNAPLFAVLEDQEGLTLGSDSSFVATVGTGPGECQAPAGAPDFTRSYEPAAAFPDFAFCAGGSNPGAACTSDAQCTGGGVCRARTPGGLDYGLGICVSSAAFNQLLKSQVECGLLLATLTELDLGAGPSPITAGLLALFLPEFSSFDPATPLRIELVPTLAPVVTGELGPSGELASLRLGQLLVEVITDEGNNTPLASVAADALVGLDFVFDDVTGSIVFTLAPPLAQDLTVALVNNNLGTNPAAVEGLLQALLPVVFPDLASSLGEFPLPEFLGLTLQGVDVGRQGEFMSIFADLVP